MEFDAYAFKASAILLDEGEPGAANRCRWDGTRFPAATL
jgi:hypothetical protein